MAAQMGAPQMVAFLGLLKSVVNDSSTGWIEQIIQDNEVLKTRIGEEKEAAGAIFRSQAKLHIEIEQKDEAVKAAIADRDEAESKAMDFENKVAIITQKLEERDGALSQNADKIKELETKVADSEKQLRTRIEEHAKVLEQRDKTIAKHVGELEKERETVKSLQNSLQAVKTDLQSTTGKLGELEQLSFQLVTMQKETM